MVDWEIAYKEAEERLELNCDEFHAHSITESCFTGDQRDITICKMGIRLTKLRRVLETLVKDFEE